MTLLKKVADSQARRPVVRGKDMKLYEIGCWLVSSLSMTNTGYS